MLKRSQPVVLIWAPCWCGQGGGHGHESGGPPAAAAAQESSAEHGGGWKQRWDGCECHRPRHVWSVNTHRDVSLWFCHTRNIIIKSSFLSWQPFSLSLPLPEWSFTEMESNLRPVSYLQYSEYSSEYYSVLLTRILSPFFFLAATFQYSLFIVSDVIFICLHMR